MDKFLMYTEQFYEGMKYSMKDMIILPGENLTEALQITVVYTAFNLICTLSGLPVFLKWQGCLLATGILGTIVLIGGRNPINEVFGRNGHVDLSTEEVEDRSEGPMDTE